MIDPNNPPQLPSASRHELEEFMLFSIAVAGKNAKVTAKALDRFLHSLPEYPRLTPFESIRLMVQNLGVVKPITGLSNMLKNMMRNRL